MKPLLSLAFFGVLWCGFNPANTLAQPNLLSQFVGTWSEKESACALLQSGQIDRMSTAESSSFGIIEISNTEIDWPYNSGTTQCEFQSRSATMADGGVRVPAVCNYKGEETNEDISLVSITSSKLQLQFEKGFWNGGKKVQLFKCTK